MLLPDELGPVTILTLPCDSELWKELATNTGEHSSNSGCLKNGEKSSYGMLLSIIDVKNYKNRSTRTSVSIKYESLYLPCVTVILL